MENLPVQSGLFSPILKLNGIPSYIRTWIPQQQIDKKVDDLPERFGQLIGHHLRANGVAADNLTPEILEATMRRLL